MKKILVYYGFFVSFLMVFISINQIKTTADFLTFLIFSPLFLYFFEMIIPERKKALNIIISQPTDKSIKKTPAHKKQIKKDVVEEKGEVVNEEDNEELDNDRRVFLKIIASAGAGLFFMSIFTKKTHAAFFGSAPMPRSLTLKDSTGKTIDPAEKQPTDGYKISEIDDSSSPAYYGFVDKNGAWFIIKEESSGSYRYSRGDSNFASNWANRASLTYGYFDEVF